MAPDRYDLPSPSPVIAVADFNNDEFPDLAVLTPNETDGIAILLGKSDGTFDGAVPSGGPADGLLMVAGDFNNDGKPDLVTASYFTPIRLYLGNGNGTFQTGLDLSNLAVLNVLKAADLDADGNLDLVFYDQVAGEVAIMLGNGNGTFQTPAGLGDSAKSLDLGKVDANDTLDLVLTGGQTDGITIYPGNGDGTFGPPIALTGFNSFTDVRVADLNGDGKADLAVLNGFFVTSFIGHGDGTFDPGVDSFAGNIPWTISLADFSGDGVLDAVVSEYDPTGGNFGYPFLQVLLGLGNGNFSTGPSYATGRGPWPIETADFGNDGVEDIAMVAPTDPRVYVLPGNGDGTFRGIFLNPGGELRTTALAVGDFYEDGEPDIAQLVNFTGDSLIFVVNNEMLLPLSQTLTAADFDGDGHLDLLTIRSDDHAVQFLRGLGTGTFDNAVVSPGPVAPYVSAIAVADFDGDGHTDLALTSQNAARTVGALWILLGNGDGTFRPGVTLPLFVPPTSVVAAEMDGDGKTDLALVGGAPGGPGQLLVLFGLGNGSFVAAGSYDTDPSPTMLLVADLVEDGFPDLAIVGARVTVWRGGGDGSFGKIYEADTPSYLVATADFNADGHLDLATESSLFSGIGDGTFTPIQTYVTGIAPSSIITSDLDADGLPETLVGQLLGGGYAVLRTARALHSASGPFIVGARVSITVDVAGFSAPTFQWRKNASPILDGGSMSGATTATLVIDPVAFSDAGSYDVVVTDSCGSLATLASSLTVEFADVPRSSLFHDDIITIATAGVTAGCGAADYCPTSVVTRAQMGVFLLKALHGADYVPPVSAQLFDDVPPGTFAYDWINALASLGVTSGCGGNNYCPDASATRAQMAVFLLKTLYGSSYTPPPALGVFGDVPPGSFAADFIEDLFIHNFASGCSESPRLYCPDSSVSRGQMAAFLVNAFFSP